MFGKIKYLTNNMAYIVNNNVGDSTDLMNIHVVFESPNQKILGEIVEITDDEIKIRMLGEFVDNKFLGGIIRKPLLSSSIRVINKGELELIIGNDSPHSLKLGNSAIYQGFPIYIDINNTLSNHLAIFGNTGSGKSWGVARFIQNIFTKQDATFEKANLFIFDAYGEYKTAFKGLNQYNSKYNYKFITTNPTEPDDIPLQIPVYLLNLDDLILLFQASDHKQIPLLERTLKLVKIFSQNDETAHKFKNHIIAKAILAVLFSNLTIDNKKAEIFTIIESCHTPEFDFNSVLKGIGYERIFSECFEIDSHGRFGESVLINEYVLSFIDNKLESTEEPQNCFYNIYDLQRALTFALISEGFQNNTQLYDDAIILKVRLSAIINSKVGNYFTYEGKTDIDNFINSLLYKAEIRCQIINVNLEDLDDTYAKIIVKILSRMFFEFSKRSQLRASIPFHIFLEEAHRYIHKDSDTFLIGYNIFERIAKEGRKYGVLLNIISQRPSELSDTVISQISNFMIFKMNHPLDIDYIEKMLPNISSDVIEKQKSLQPGTFVGFGSAFKIPTIVKMDIPNPPPYSSNCDVQKCWQ